MQQQPNTVPPAKGIDVGQLEKQLTAMWAGTTEKQQAGDAGLMRACVLNLIVYTTSGESRDEVDALLRQVVESHPCRALVLAVDTESSETKLDAHVSTRCQELTRAARQICGEQVWVEASGAALKSVPSAIAPLLVTDVPVFLWWKDIPHYEDVLFDRLSDLSDRIVIDSASFDHPREDLIRLAQLLEDDSRTAIISDLNWGRLTLWRALVAGFWDVLDYKIALAQIERVTLEYELPEKTPGEVSTKALLAVGWMASRLGWEVVAENTHSSAGETSFTFRNGERNIGVILRPAQNTERRGGMLTSLTITSADGGEFFVGLKPEENKLETAAHISGRESAVGRVLNYQARTEGQRLNSELEILSRDTIYESAVKVAAHLALNLKQ